MSGAGPMDPSTLDLPVDLGPGGQPAQFPPPPPGEGSTVLDRIADGSSQTVRLAPRQRAPLPMPMQIAQGAATIFAPGPTTPTGAMPGTMAPQLTNGAPGTAGGTGPGNTGTDTYEVGKVKLSSVLDQADDTEIRAIGVEQLRELLDNWKKIANDNEEPSEEEEATGEQLSALAHRLRLGGTPFVDFGIWRAHGSELGRVIKFAAYFPTPNGGFALKEIVGPTTFHDWERSWRVFAFAMEVLGAASRTRLDKYRKLVQNTHDDYPNFWWLIALADIKMRKVHMERIRRRLAAEHAELTGVGLRSDFDVRAPWDTVFREAARDNEYWSREVDKKVIQFTTAQKSRQDLADPGFGNLHFAAGAGQSGSRGTPGPSSEEPPKKARRKQKAERAAAKAAAAGAPAGQASKGNSKGDGKGKGKKGVDHKVAGKFLFDQQHRQICWRWNQTKSGCQDPCPGGRAHVCEFCRGLQGTPGHRSCEHV